MAKNNSTVKKQSEVANKPSEIIPSHVTKQVTASTSKTPAKKQPEPVKIPPPESSSDEDEESSSEEGEEDEPLAPSPVVASMELSADSESDSESSESESDKTPPPTTASAGKKRKHEEAPPTEEVNVSNHSMTESGTESKKKLFQRVWSEEDEILLLQGIIDFKNTTGKTVNQDMSGFFERLKNSFSFEVKGLYQFQKKISSLKNKYLGKKKKGLEPTFKKSHEKTCMELAKTIWLDVVDSTKVKVEEDNSFDVEADDWFERSFLVGVVKDLSKMVDEESVKRKWSLVPKKKKKKIEEKFKSLEAHDHEGALLKADLIHDVSYLIFKS